MTIYYPVAREPKTGGDYVNLDHARTLFSLGLDVKIWVLESNCDFFQNQEITGSVPIIRNGIDPVWMHPDDIFVLPEVTPNLIKQFHNPDDPVSCARSVMHFQNPFYVVESFSCAQEINAHPAERIIVPSEYAERRMRETGVEKNISIIHPYISDIFRPQQKSRSPVRILYSNRKRHIETEIVIYYFRSVYRGAHPVEFINIANEPREKVAALMAQIPIFASFAERESLGLMALEAMASGCHVIGFSGYTGGFSEYLTEQNGDWIDEGDYLGFAHKLVEAVEQFSAGESSPKIQAGLQTVERYFRRPSFENELKTVFSDILNIRL